MDMTRFMKRNRRMVGVEVDGVGVRVVVVAIGKELPWKEHIKDEGDRCSDQEAIRPRDVVVVNQAREILAWIVFVQLKLRILESGEVPGLKILDQFVLGLWRDRVEVELPTPQ